MNPDHDRPSAFPETRWSLIVRAARREGTDGLEPLSELCRIYWPPVYAYVRSLGHTTHDAEDLTQGFFAAFLERNDFARADPERGRLRSYLLTSVKHYLINARRHAGREKRGGQAIHFSLDLSDAEERWAAVAVADRQSPDVLYDRQWATTLLEQVIAHLEAGYRERGKGGLFARLKPCLMRSDAPGELAGAAQDLGMSETAVRVAIHRLRQRYAAALREAVADTLSEGEDVERELDYLKTVFG